MDSIVDLFKPCLPRLEELTIYVRSVTPPSNILSSSLEISCLRKGDLTFNAFPNFFSSGMLRFITDLLLLRIDFGTLARDASFKTLYELPCMLSHLPSLYKLTLWGLGAGYDRHDLERLPKVRSISESLHSLDITEHSYDHAMPLLAIFTNYHIDRIHLREIIQTE